MDLEFSYQTGFGNHFSTEALKDKSFVWKTMSFITSVLEAISWIIFIISAISLLLLLKANHFIYQLHTVRPDRGHFQKQDTIKRCTNGITSVLLFDLHLARSLTRILSVSFLIHRSQLGEHLNRSGRTKEEQIIFPDPLVSINLIINSKIKNSNERI